MSIRYAVSVPPRRRHEFTVPWGLIKSALLATIEEDERFKKLAHLLDSANATMEVHEGSNFSITVSIPECD